MTEGRTLWEGAAEVAWASGRASWRRGPEVQWDVPHGRRGESCRVRVSAWHPRPQGKARREAGGTGCCLNVERAALLAWAS